MTFRNCRSGRRGREVAQFIIRYHSLPDEAGYQAIRKNSRISREEAEHLKLLYESLQGYRRSRQGALQRAGPGTAPHGPMPEGWLSLQGALLQEEIEQVVGIPLKAHI